MTENKCKSLENLLSAARLPHKQSPTQFESYRDELHRELAKHWPIRIHKSDSTNMPLTTSKSSARSSIRDGKQSNFIINGPNSTRVSEKKRKANNRLLPMDSEVSFNDSQQRDDWRFKAREGVIPYPLPDGLPDSSALYTKLQKLMKTDTIHLNDRRFWSKLEKQYKKLRKQHLQENLERLRQNQQKYEQELISKGILPHTTEEAIKQHAKQQQTQIKTDVLIPNNTHRKNCFLTDISSNVIPATKSDRNPMLSTDELGAFESDNVHPCFDEICSNYQFQTKSGQELGEKFSRDLHQAQMQIKTIFPKTTRRDSIRQELAAVRTSEGLYAYSNRLPKRTSK